jgi:hypothetical protein
MSVEAEIVNPPQHPVHALTTYELLRYRRELEQALALGPEHVATRAALRAKLAEVLSEQDTRTKIAAGGR